MATRHRDTGIKYLPLGEMLSEGYLQEANRLFFHPRGLALSLAVDRHGKPLELSVWDYREDEEGIIFGPDVIDREKAKRVEDERLRHVERRRALFDGETIQPLTEEDADGSGL